MFKPAFKFVLIASVASAACTTTSALVYSQDKQDKPTKGHSADDGPEKKYQAVLSDSNVQGTISAVATEDNFFWIVVTPPAGNSRYFYINVSKESARRLEELVYLAIEKSATVIVWADDNEFVKRISVYP